MHYQEARQQFPGGRLPSLGAQEKVHQAGALQRGGRKRGTAYKKGRGGEALKQAVREDRVEVMTEPPSGNASTGSHCLLWLGVNYSMYAHP